MAQNNPLSKREKEVVTLLLQGKGNKQIASTLGISDRTVEFHLTNVYKKFQASSRIELILKLGNSTGNAITENLGYSTVDSLGKNDENRDRHISQMDWPTSFRDAVSIIGKEPEMKKRWIVYFFAGLIFGAGYWHYFGATAKFFNDKIGFSDNAIGAGSLFILALLAYFGVWLIPVILPAIYEFHRSISLRLSVLAVVTVWVSAVLGYYLNYLVMLAIFGLPNMEYLVIFGQQTSVIWQNWSVIFPRLIFYNFLKWAVVGIFVSGIAGFITSLVYSFLSKKNYKVSPA
jgi:DNA-binding CsgD family transcriptional regulator